MKFRLVEVIRDRLVSLSIGYHLWINSQLLIRYKIKCFRKKAR